MLKRVSALDGARVGAGVWGGFGERAGPSTGLLVHPETLVPATQQDFAAPTTAEELPLYLAVSRPAEAAAIACAFDGVCN